MDGVEGDALRDERGNAPRRDARIVPHGDGGALDARLFRRPHGERLRNGEHRFVGQRNGIALHARDGCAAHVRPVFEFEKILFCHNSPSGSFLTARAKGGRRLPVRLHYTCSTIVFQDLFAKNTAIFRKNLAENVRLCYTVREKYEPRLWRNLFGIFLLIFLAIRLYSGVIASRRNEFCG